MVILGECKCMRKEAKQGIEWALDYHISSLDKEIRDKEILVEKARSEFVEIVGREPGDYTRLNIPRLKTELKFYLALRKEIIELPRCDEPAFEVKS